MMVEEEKEQRMSVKSSSESLWEILNAVLFLHFGKTRKVAARFFKFSSLITESTVSQRDVLTHTIKKYTVA